MKRGFRTIAAAAALTAAPAAAALADSAIFCIELHRVVDAAQYEGGFVQLERARGTPPRLGFAYCRADTRHWYCHQNLAPEALSLETLAAKTEACLPEARRVPSDWHGEAEYVLPSARIRIEETGGPRAHVGRIVSFIVERVESESGEAR